MRGIFSFFAMVIVSNTAFTQSFTPKVLATTGNYATSGGLSLSQTIGETFNITLSNGSTLLTEGQQQPVPAAIALPISWLNVSGDLNHKMQAVISWQVEEINVMYYEVEKNTNSGYVAIDKQTSKGNGDHAYTFIDPEAVNGEANYRIKQIEIDGKYSYSKIINLKTTIDYSISVYPNPVITTVKIVVNNPKLKNTEAILFDPNGKKVKEIWLMNSTEIDLSNMITGMYLLRFADQTSIKILKLDKY
jgi:hypothetical protein